MRTPALLGAAVLTVGVVLVGIWLVNGRSPQSMAKSKVDPKLMEAHAKPKEFIAKNETSKDVQVQTLVTRARMTDAYDLAQKKDFASARAEFIEASFKHKGSDAMSPGFGTLPDQAAYQAIVCLEAESKKDEAKKEYRKFMKDRKLSPLVQACFRRLERLNGKPLDSDEALLQSAIAEQEKRARFETSVCGPKCLEKMLPYLGKSQKGYVELAKLCGTSDQGTSLDGLKKGCESLGLAPVGLELNAKDFNTMKKPFLWLQTDHYLAILEIKNGKAHIFDPRYKLDTWQPLPKEDEGGFRATVLAFEVPTTDLVSDPQKPSKKS